MREHETEPVPGLPERLPQGEAVLWQGAPEWRGLARHAFRIRTLAAYFGVLALWRGWILAEGGGSASDIAAGAVWLLTLGLLPIAILAAYAVLSARTTLYTITNRRVVMRVGVALPKTVNLPFASIASAGLRRYGRGGDILLALQPPHRVSYVALWPHVRMLRPGRPEPVLRALPDADAAAQVLARALAASASMPAPAQQAEASAGDLRGQPAAALA